MGEALEVWFGPFPSIASLECPHQAELFRHQYPVVVVCH